MSIQPINLTFPAAGVVRRVANSAAFGDGPMPTPWAVNVRLEDTLTKRLRGGSFTGLAMAEVPANRELIFQDGAGNTITDDSGNPLFLDEEVSVPTGDSRVWLLAGEEAPAQHPAEVIYRGRLIRPDGAVILASRQGNYDDWNYGADISDQGRAFAIQLAESGEVGGTVTALIPRRDLVLFAATADSLWMVQGDPAANGTLRKISSYVGIVGPRAWCKGPGVIYLLSTHGLYVMQSSGDGLQAVSENAIPVELTGVDNEDAVLSYNHADRGVYIHLPSGTVSFFYDTERQGFWPFNTEVTDSHVLIGPIKLGNIDQNGVINTIHGMVAAGSDPVTWRIVIGETAEEAAENGKAAITAALESSSFSSYVQYSGEWVAGRSKTSRPRVRGMWACIWLHSQGEWAYERITMQIAAAGAWRD